MASRLLQPHAVVMADCFHILSSHAVPQGHFHLFLLTAYLCMWTCCG